jgi:peptidyl-prolyl cis-trans isomerase SurA
LLSVEVSDTTMLNRIPTAGNMKKNILFLFSFLIVLTNVYAQTQKVVADKVIAVVGDKVVLKSDIDNSIIDMQRQGIEIPPNARCQTLEQAMGVKALVLQAEKDSLPVTDDEVDADIDNQIRYFINMYGSKDELEKIAGKTVYQMKQDYRESFRERKLAAAMRDKIVGDIHITPSEVQNFFDKIPKDSLPFYESQLQLRQIVVYPKANRDAEEYAVDQLKDFKQQIESGNKKFETLASIYSKDPGSKDKGGEYQINRNEKQWDPTFLAKAFSLKEGQISNPFKTKFGYHIIQMESRNGDDALIRHILLIPEISPVEINLAIQKLDTIRVALIAKQLQFGEAVSRYSDEESSKFTGGNILGKDGSPFLTIDQLDKDMVLMLKDLKPGDYSKPTQFTDDRGKTGIRIIYLVSKSDPHRENMKDDYSRVAQNALEEKKSDALDSWFNKNVANNYIMVDDDYKDCDEMKKWLPKKK